MVPGDFLSDARGNVLFRPLISVRTNQESCNSISFTRRHITYQLSKVGFVVRNWC